VRTGSTALIEVLGEKGFDCVMLASEHSGRVRVLEESDPERGTRGIGALCA
jgi:2-keto-3-deoxy-L-rhamnonate aldolase RhmA